LRGTRLDAPWARETLMLLDTQGYVASPFEPLSSYDGQPSWVFGAALRGAEGRIVGGIAVVLDATEQLGAMLKEVLPDGGGEQHCALFVDATGRVLASSGAFEAGTRLEMPAALLDPPPEGGIGFLIHQGHHFAAGSRRSAGYREFRGLGVMAVVMSAVGPVREPAISKVPPFVFARRAGARTEAMDVATVACGAQWLALPASSIVAAIQDARPTRIPGRAPWLLGVIRHGDALVPVVELARLLGQKSRDPRTIVVARVDGQLIGLAVDQLGDVLEVASSEIATFDAQGGSTGGASASMTPGILRARSAEDSAALMLDLAAVLSATGQG
jgi:chemotaxis signal transduction protein